MKAYLFGPLRLYEADGRPAPLPPTADGRTLLAYLLLHADRPFGRSHLAALLKPDDSEEKARRALTHALRQIRRALPDGAVIAVGDSVQLNGALIERDVARFDSLLEGALVVARLVNELAKRDLTEMRR